MEDTPVEKRAGINITGPCAHEECVGTEAGSTVIIEADESVIRLHVTSVPRFIEVLREVSGLDNSVPKDVWDIIQDINSSWTLALTSLGVSGAIIEECQETVNDYVTNHYGDD